MLQAYIIRNETVYFANKPGSIQYYIEEGDLICKGTKVLDLTYEKQEREESQYSNIMERIQRFNGGESIFSDDIKRIDLQINKLEETRQAALNEAESEKADRLASQIERLAQKKEYIKAADLAAKDEILRQNSPSGSYGKNTGSICQPDERCGQLLY